MTQETNHPGDALKFRRSLTDFVRTLEGMREAGWLTTAPATPTDDATASRDQRLPHARNAFHPTNEETK
ncbi:hypothetical protein ATK86_3736 [Nocardia fluminea]|uniref:Uncharacterized protein n=1 Tax=Nocardia fluminea TaxID=134984 RepID=A0A2N3VCI3_9NOCA|nr:hypothetical protein ATK86_3736 [Nocardia fluminea]